MCNTIYYTFQYILAEVYMLSMFTSKKSKPLKEILELYKTYDDVVDKIKYIHTLGYSELRKNTILLLELELKEICNIIAILLNNENLSILNIDYTSNTPILLSPNFMDSTGKLDATDNLPKYLQTQVNSILLATRSLVIRHRLKTITGNSSKDELVSTLLEKYNEVLFQSPFVDNDIIKILLTSIINRKHIYSQSNLNKITDFLIKSYYLPN